MTILMLAIAIICGLGWLITRVSLAAVIKYMADKGYTPPSTTETKACCNAVVRKMLHLK